MFPWMKFEFRRWSSVLILLPILIFGTFLRFTDLNKQSYWMDEGYTVNAVISQIENGTRDGAVILDSGDSYFCPVYCYPTRLIVSLLGDQPFAYRFLSALSGVVFIIIAYWLTKRFFQQTSAALLAAGFTAFSYWQIAWSRQARWYTLFEVFFWLSILAFHAFLNSKTRKRQTLFLSLALLATLTAIATQGIAYVLPILLLIWYVIEKRPPFKHFFIVCGATTMLLAIAEYGFQLKLLAHVLDQFTLTNNIFYHLSFYGRTYWPLILISSIGFGFAPSEKRKIYLLLFSPFIVYLILLSIFTEIIHYRYLFHTTPAFLILGAVSIIDLQTKIRKPAIRTGFLLISCILFFLTYQGILVPKDFYSLEADDPTTLKRKYYAYTPQPDFKSAYAYIKDHLKPTDLIISTQPQFNKIYLQQPGYWLAYDYLGRDRFDPASLDAREHYVNAEIIHSLEELTKAIDGTHGYIVLDSMAVDNRIPLKIIRFIQSHSGLVFYDERHSYSQIWVYQF